MMESDEFNLLPLSDSEKALLAEVKEAVLAAENSGAFDDAATTAAAASSNAGSPAATGWEHPAVRFLASTFVRKCLTQLEVLRAHGVAYSLKELVWFVLNLERDPFYMLGLSGSDCTEEQVRSLADRLNQSPAISVPPEPLLLLPTGVGTDCYHGNGLDDDAASSSQSVDASDAAFGSVRDWPTVKEALERLRVLAEAASDAAADERQRPRRRGLPAERPVLTVTLPELPDLPPCPLDPVGGQTDNQ
ncbi:hypothetical protein BOX15_Mlig009665g1 [Macrostomum lignano]|uniref:Ubiquitinyl hydrolase 1 n=2 Tax=Macrostomum lignano TaxID=282301 RepID=A0A1I8H2W4_9PLAT|nr:hypothetical protein BOX15_Mlig009665g1 [Macrostomum lignano]